MDFKDLVKARRSHRRFGDAEISADDVRLLLRAALMSPTSKGQRAWQFVVVDDKTDIEKLSDSKDAGAQFLKGAAVVIVVLGDGGRNDCWIEDGSLAAMSIQYQAEDLGLGSCWAQLRGRHLSDGTATEDVVRGILGIPDNMDVLCAIGIGRKADERKPQNEDALKWENVHIGKW